MTTHTVLLENASDAMPVASSFSDALAQVEGRSKTP